MSAGDPLRTWTSSDGRLRSGALESVQRVVLPRPVVEPTTAGARRLGELYWREVEASTLGLVRARAAKEAPELRVLGVGPALLRFGPPTIVASNETVSCRYPVRGGLLARAPGGSIVLTQTHGEAVELRSAITGLSPGLASARAGRPPGLLYRQQARLHSAVSRRYFARLWREASG